MAVLKSADTDQAVGGERSGAAGGAVLVAAVDGFWTEAPLAALLRTQQLRDCTHTNFIHSHLFVHSTNKAFKELHAIVFFHTEHFWSVSDNGIVAFTQLIWIHPGLRWLGHSKLI